jgi:hypothetical protein
MAKTAEVITIVKILMRRTPDMKDEKNERKRKKGKKLPNYLQEKR